MAYQHVLFPRVRLRSLTSGHGEHGRCKDGYSYESSHCKLSPLLRDQRRWSVFPRHPVQRRPPINTPRERAILTMRPFVLHAIPCGIRGFNCFMPSGAIQGVGAVQYPHQGRLMALTRVGGLHHEYTRNSCLESQGVVIGAMSKQ